MINIDSISYDQRTEVKLLESEWNRINLSGPRPASRADIITVLSNLQTILIRATLNDFVFVTSISDVILDTAVSTVGDVEAKEVEKCRCPSGYSGTSCEVII